jgi:DNA-binding PucR family transcriptional regulator
MTDDQKALMRPKVVSEEERDGRTVLVYDSGLERDKASGKIIKASPAHQITPENAMQLVNIRHTRARREYLTGLIQAKEGEEIPDNLESLSLDQLEELAGETRKALWRRWTKVFLESTAIRGMGESASKLLAGPGMPELEGEQAEKTISPRVVVLLAELHRRGINPDDVIDAEE